MNVRCWFFPLITLAVGVAPAAGATGHFKPSQASTMLIEAADLERQLATPNLRILDTRSKDDYVKGHIENAVWVDVVSWQALGKTEGGFQNAVAWGEKVAELGIDQRTRVVVYGSRLPDAARIWWTLKYLGLKNVALLNGGWNAWQEEDRAITTSEPKVASSEFTPKFDSDRLEEADAAKRDVQEGKVKFVDTRSTDEFTGKEVRGERGGHISGAVHLEWKELLTEDGRFKPRDELKELFRQRGILPDGTAVCY